MRRPMLMRLEATDGRTAPRCRGKSRIIIGRNGFDDLKSNIQVSVNV
jgi:hypothetical protein